ncbi:MAG: transposase [Oscillospiraceae bacterium]|nr:transposase [Oscillospiraceae bacterium]
MDFPKRKLPRLSGYDYSRSNYYFVTICTDEKKDLFGEIGKLNCFGKIAEQKLLEIEQHYENVFVDKYVIMPNHIHAIIILKKLKTERSRPFPTLSEVVGLYKSGVTKEIHKIESELKIWQKSFNDVIIRNEKAYNEICKYIYDNPLKAVIDY